MMRSSVVGLCWLCVFLYGTLLQAIPVVSQQALYQAGFDQPTAMIAEAGGGLAVLDGVNRRIVRLSANGAVSKRFEPGLNDALDMVAGHIDGQPVWLIADTGNHRLLRLDPATGLSEAVPLESSAENKPGDRPPEPVAVALMDDNAYWADRTSHRVCRLSLKTRKNLGCFGGRGEQDGQFQYPWQMAVDRDGYLHVTDILNARIQVLDKTGRFFARISRFGLSDGELYRPGGLALDPAHDRLYISDAYFGTISIFERGDYLGVLQDDQGHTLKLDAPSGLAVSGDQLYVAETGASRVLKLTLAEVAGTPALNPAKTVAISQKNCIQCHLSWASAAAPDVRDPDADGVLPEASFRMCYSCHQGPIMDSRKAIHRDAQHPTVYESASEQARHAKQGPRKDKLPNAFPLDDHKRLTCTSCHTPHTDTTQAETLYAGHANAWLRVPGHGGDLCERCHESKGKNARPNVKDALHGHNHPLGIRLARPPYTDATGYASQPELHHGLPNALRTHGAVTGAEDTIICQSCHQIHGGSGEGILTALPVGHNELCVSCHDRQSAKDREDAHRKGVHPVNFKLDKPFEWRGHTLTEINCSTCHPVHQGAVGTALLPEGIARAEELCQGCHQRQHAENREQARYKGIHPVNLKLDEAVTLNGQKQEFVTCLSCHAVHNGKPNTAALVETDRDGELCSHCHTHKQTVTGTDHDLRLTAKTGKNAYDQLPAQSGVCGTCHTLHRGKGEWPALSAVKPVTAPTATGDEKVDDTPFQRDRLCLNCHQSEGLGSKKTIRHFSHPHQGVILRSRDKNMPLLDEREQNTELGRISCVTCHDPHVFDPRQHQAKSVPNMELSTNRENREGTHSDSFLRHKGVTGTFCVDCHGQEGLVRYQYFHDAHRARGQDWEDQ